MAIAEKRFSDCYGKVKSIGRGSFGECFVCRCTANNELFCVKEVDYATLGPHAPEVVRLRTEMARSKEIQHRNILPLLQVFDDAKRCMLHSVYPYRAGESVEDLITAAVERGELLPEKAVWGLMDGICQALQFISTLTTVYATIPTAHLNLVPSNIFLSSLSSTLISEPCITRSVFSSDWAHNNTYTAPEIRNTSLSTIQGNVWTVGSIVYTLVTGRLVIDEEQKNVDCQSSNLFPVELPKQYSTHLGSLLAAMLSRQEKNRPSLSIWRSEIKGYEKKAHIRSFCGVQCIAPTDLMSAVMQMNIDGVYKNLSQHSARIAGGETAMMLAAERNFPSAVSALMKYESGLYNEDRETALLIACRKDYPEIVKLLAPVEGHIRNADGMGPIHICKKHGSTNSLRIMLDLPVEQQYGILVPDDVLRKHHRAYRNTTLHASVLADDVQAVQQNLDSVKVFSNKGRTALSLAAEYGCNKQIIEMLLEHECELMSQMTIYRDSANNDVLRQPAKRHQKESSESVIYRNPSLLRQYLEESKAIRCQDRWSALMFAAYHNNVEAVKLLLAREKGLQTPHYKHTALILAVQGRSTACVELLTGEETTLTDRNGDTALMYAATMGEANLVQILAKYEMGLCNKFHESALFKALSKDHTDIARILLMAETHLVDTEETTALMLAASRKNTEIVKTLAERSFGVGRQNIFGYTALMAAAQVDATECIKILADHESKMVRTNGMSAMMLAAARNLPDSVQLLMKYELAMRDNEGDTALLIAIHENADLAAILLANTEEAYIPDRHGNFPIMVASQLNRFAVVEALIPRCNSQLTYVNGLTPLMYAANQGYTELIALLAEAKQTTAMGTAKMDPLFLRQQDKEGWTALMYAVDKKNTDCVKILAPLEHSIADSSGNSALYIAVTLGDVASISLLMGYEGKQLLRSGKIEKLIQKITDEEVIKLLHEIVTYV